MLLFTCLHSFTVVFKIWFLNFRFCSTRWIEDESVASRAIEIWESIVKVIKHWQVLLSSKRPKQNKSYETLVKHYLDRVMLAKFHFFKFVASIFKNYLTSFQTDNPMLPFFLRSSRENYEEIDEYVC